MREKETLFQLKWRFEDELKCLAVSVFSVCCAAVRSSESGTNDGQSVEVCFALNVRLQIYIQAAASVTALPVFLSREILLITTTRMYRCRPSSHSQDTHCSRFMTLSALSVNFNTPASVFRGALALSRQMETFFPTQMKMALRSLITPMSRGLRAPPILRQRKSVPALQSHRPVNRERLSSENINLAV